MWHPPSSIVVPAAAPISEQRTVMRFEVPAVSGTLGSLRMTC